jgi:hypothetical protein
MLPKRPLLSALRYLVLGAFTAGCHPPYRHPATSEPHAVLRYRRMHEGIPGATETEDLLINGETAFGFPTRRSSLPHVLARWALEVR